MTPAPSTMHPISFVIEVGSALAVAGSWFGDHVPVFATTLACVWYIVNLIAIVRDRRKK